VILREDVGGRERATTDEERVARGADLENRVRSQSRSLEISPFDRLPNDVLFYFILFYFIYYE